MPSIHPSAVIGQHAQIGQGVTVGPFCVIEDDVVIGDRCSLLSHVVLKRGTQLGSDNLVAEGAVLGARPQHLRAGQEVGRLRVGNGNQIREYVTMHCGLTAEDTTVVGDWNLIMVAVHIGHDSQIGSHVILANNTLLGGHVQIEDFAYLSGAVAMHQFCRVGQHAMVGGQAHLVQDVPPYVLLDGASSRAVGLNAIGLRRRNFSSADLQQLKTAYRVIYTSGLKWQTLLERLRADYPTGPAAAFHTFLSASKRGIVQQRRGSRMATLRLRTEDGQDGQESLRKVG